MEPKLVAIKGGWTAVGSDWAVFGECKAEAIKKFREAEAKHEEIVSRSDKSEPSAHLPAWRSGLFESPSTPSYTMGLREALTSGQGPQRSRLGGP